MAIGIKLTLISITQFVFVLNSMINMFLGGSNGTTLSTIKANVDISMNFTIISSNDFNCTTSNGCITDGIVYNMTRLNTTIQFNKAQMAMNLIKVPNTGAFQFIYICNDTTNVGSTLGLSPNSKFLQYYYQQNSINGFNVSFSLDANNNLQFHTFNTTGFVVMPAQDYNVTVISTEKNIIDSVSRKICISNSIDNMYNNQSIFGVAAANYSSWSKAMTTLYNKENNKMEEHFGFIWTQANGIFVTQMDYKVTDIVSSNKIPLIQSVPDDVAAWKGCDIFTGSLMLLKYNFMVLYSETPTGYVYNYALNSSDQLIDIDEQERDDGVSIWIILLIILLILAILYFGYTWYLKQNEEHNHEAQYLAVNVPPVELHEMK